MALLNSINLHLEKVQNLYVSFLTIKSKRAMKMHTVLLICMVYLTQSLFVICFLEEMKFFHASVWYIESLLGLSLSINKLLKKIPLVAPRFKIVINLFCWFV